MEAPYPRLISVEPIAPHSLKLHFADGVEGTVDLSADLWGELFEPLKDPKFFALVRLDPDGAFAWPHGLDLAPDALYEDLIAVVKR